ncbi:hypothetical protein POVCU2_0021430 [Plasmodium ovale curtisi]|uniref:Uncharacterized protein n=1 Tax=Plasmodium ovale curtisi TaxID=864141 RepID=A0A1A8VST0_PLAOA|nr:hypothetical protein POVCU2_0021430 [Plasmodium ovale curtisi]SBS90939.1 hypothetical protein POVCU1_019430 [Plasmodium ovale curtisi]
MSTYIHPLFSYEHMCVFSYMLKKGKNFTNLKSNGDITTFRRTKQIVSSASSSPHPRYFSPHIAEKGKLFSISFLLLFVYTFERKMRNNAGSYNDIPALPLLPKYHYLNRDNLRKHMVKQTRRTEIRERKMRKEGDRMVSFITLHC